MNPFEEWLQKILTPQEPMKQKAPAKKRSNVSSETDVARNYQQVWNSPFVRDTLGVPRDISAVTQPFGQDFLGLYSPEDKTVYFDTTKDPRNYPMAGATPADAPSFRTIATHEAAHPLQGSGRFPSYASVNMPRLTATYAPPYSDMAGVTRIDAGRGQEFFNLLANHAATGGNLRPISQAERAAFETLSPYGSFGKPVGENKATTDPREAFAQAFVNAINFLVSTKDDPKLDYRKLAGGLEANTPGMGLIVQDLLKEPVWKGHPLRGKIFTTGENANAAKPRKKP